MDAQDGPRSEASTGDTPPPTAAASSSSSSLKHPNAHADDVGEEVPGPASVSNGTATPTSIAVESLPAYGTGKRKSATESDSETCSEDSEEASNGTGDEETPLTKRPRCDDAEAESSQRAPNDHKLVPTTQQQMGGNSENAFFPSSSSSSSSSNSNSSNSSDSNSTGDEDSPSTKRPRYDDVEAESSQRAPNDHEIEPTTQQQMGGNSENAFFPSSNSNSNSNSNSQGGAGVSRKVHKGRSKSRSRARLIEAFVFLGATNCWAAAGRFFCEHRLAKTELPNKIGCMTRDELLQQCFAELLRNGDEASASELVHHIDKSAKDWFDYSGSGMTLLHLAVIVDMKSVFKALLRQGALLGATAGDGVTTPLHLAFFHCHLVAAELLISYGASVMSRDVQGRSLLVLAAQFDWLFVVQYCLEQRTKFHNANYIPETADELLVVKCMILRFNRPNLLELVQALEPPPLVAVSPRATTLHVSRFRTLTEEVMSAVGTLETRRPFAVTAVTGIPKCSRRRLILTPLERDTLGATLLHHAFGHPTVSDATVRLLIASSLEGARNELDKRDCSNPAADNYDDPTALLAALANGHDNGALLVAEAGANIHLRGIRTQNTALHLAAYSGCLDSLHFLLRGVAAATRRQVPLPVNVPNALGETPLHFAAAAARLNAVTVLINRGADVNAMTQPPPGVATMMSPLDYALARHEVTKYPEVIGSAKIQYSTLNVIEALLVAGGRAITRVPASTTLRSSLSVDDASRVICLDDFDGPLLYVMRTAADPRIMSLALKFAEGSHGRMVNCFFDNGANGDMSNPATLPLIEPHLAVALLWLTDVHSHGCRHDLTRVSEVNRLDYNLGSHGLTVEWMTRIALRHLALHSDQLTERQVSFLRIVHNIEYMRCQDEITRARNVYLPDNQWVENVHEVLTMSWSKLVMLTADENFLKLCVDLQQQRLHRDLANVLPIYATDLLHRIHRARTHARLRGSFCNVLCRRLKNLVLPVCDKILDYLPIGDIKHFIVACAVDLDDIV